MTVSSELKVSSLFFQVLHSRDRQLQLQPLFISEDKTGLLGSAPQGGGGGGNGGGGGGGGGAGRVRRTKSPRSSDPKDKKEEKETRTFPRSRIEKIFNKSFKIFN